MFGRPLSFAFLTLTACGASTMAVQEPVAEETPVSEETPATTATISCDEAEEVVIAARSQEELQALAVEVTLAEAASPALVAARSMPPMRGRRFYVYEDSNSLGLGQRCAALPGVHDDVDGLMLRVNGRRDAQGVREYHEVLAGSGGITVTGGGSEGPGFGTAHGDAMSLDHRLVRADAEHRLYASGVMRRHLACRPESRIATCSGGGEASCTALAPEVISSALTPGLSGFGGGGVGTISSTQCRATCEETECEEALGDQAHRTIRHVYEPDAATIGIFRSRAACRAYARERAPLLPRIAAASGECECGRCDRSDEEHECYNHCESACAEQNEALLEAAPELEPGGFTQVALVTVTTTEHASGAHRRAAQTRVERYRECAQAALESSRVQSPMVAWHTVRWTVDGEGSVGHVLEGDELPESLGHGLDACLEASAERSLRAGYPGAFAIRVRMLLGAGQPSSPLSEG